MASEPFIGQIQAFGFNFTPRNWAPCDGRLLAISANSALFSLLGTTYGGDGRSTFALPDLRGRMAVGFGNGPGLTPRDLGETGGSENVTLTASQIPSHTHTATTTGTQRCQSGAGDSDTPVGNFPAKDAVNENFSTTSNDVMGAVNVTTQLGSAGGNQPHSNMPPYLCLNLCIALSGIFPSRN